MNAQFGDIYCGRTVLVTGHTGFKGSWLSHWLVRLGAKVVGYSLDPAQRQLPEMASILGDIRDRDRLAEVFAEHAPEVVFHLAAQPLVRLSYQQPVETLSTNVLGTALVLEACRAARVRAIVNITSDKCYKNNNWSWGYREIDSLGGSDPYSASKGCAELVSSAWRDSFFNLADYGRTHHTLLATARSGNVVGGGDWAADRIIPDIARAAGQGREVVLRNPYATRPWQHVLDPLAGYLLLGQWLLEGRTEAAQGWNFGPAEFASVSVEQVTRMAAAAWDAVRYRVERDSDSPREAGRLQLDCSKALNELGWRPVWDVSTAIAKTIAWYRGHFCEGVDIASEQLDEYIHRAGELGLCWVANRSEDDGQQ
jgi:CDP-glucose 4,6-dehydratase